MRDVKSVDPQPRTPKVWADGATWLKSATELLNQGICGVLAWDQIAMVNGREKLVV